MPKVVLISNLPKDIETVVLGYAPEGYDAVAISAGASDEEKIALTADADFLIVYATSVSENLLRSSPKVKHLQLLSAGYDRIDINLTNALNIPVSNNGGANSWAVADATVGLILGVERRLIEADAFVRAGKWRGTIQGFDTYELAGKTVGIVGLGNIGKKVARRLYGFETVLRYADAIPADPALEAELGLERRSLDELLVEADILTLHVPLLASTKAMIGAVQLAKMKPSSILINTCRGDVVDEAALIEALQNKTIRAAGLDVFDQEPVSPDNPLLSMPNVMLSAHVAGTTYDTFFRRAQFAFENIKGIWEGKPPMAVVSQQ
ncbi:MAG: 2-hydroxyacid dehydrogenase [Dehalococcoidia bacterium]